MATHGITWNNFYSISCTFAENLSLVVQFYKAEQQFELIRKKVNIDFSSQLLSYAFFTCFMLQRTKIASKNSLH